MLQFVFQSAIFYAVLVQHIHFTSAYIRHDSLGRQNFTYFTPYAKGFVGVYGEASNFLRERINEGSFENPAKELLYEEAVRTQTCPGMVGPFTDGNYFCTAKEYGYCDRRSGVCFCNIGYQGIDCSECTPAYFKVGFLCYPKKTCPNDCNGAGVCDYWTGTCNCLPHRVGEDCGTLLCKSFNDLCEACSTTQCLRCPDGYYLTESNDCSSCYDYDPRCAGCTKDLGCTLCADPILTSVRRSGYRSSDPRVPVEEDTREFSITLPFGTKSPESFADAEAFIVATTPENKLQDNAISCHQGYNNDETWECEKLQASHIVCGHKGVFSFTYPNYVINETSRFFRVSVRRSGGGFGNVLVNYFIRHFTTSDNDLTATAPYTTSQTLEFDEGVVERSFLVSIIDDNIVEENEVFQIVLELPEGGGSIGAQFRTNVTIVDDDLYLLSPVFTSPTETEVVTVANESLSVTVQAVLANGESAVVGGERFLAVIENDMDTWASSTNIYRSSGQRHASRTLCDVVDNGNGTYVINGILREQGRYQLRIWHAFPLGLMGTYHRDAFMENVALERIDRFVNFTWGSGRLLPRGADYISIRWTGVIRPDTSDDYYFLVDADDHARLWIGGSLLIDHWHEQRADLEPFRSVKFEENSLYEVVLEYREVRGDAYARLMWTTATNYSLYEANGGMGNESFVVIPPENMYSLHEIGNSPVDVTVTSGETSPTETECTGPGLFSGTTLEVSYFSFCPRDRYRNFRDDADDFFLSSELFNVTLTLVDDMGYGGQGREVLHPHLVYDVRTHCFEAEYIAERAGKYELNILYHEWHGEPGEHVSGSPFTVNIDPNIMNGPYSRVEGFPDENSLIAGVCYTFTVISKDGSHNLRLKGGEELQTYLYRVGFFEDAAQEVASTEMYDPNLELVRYGEVFDGLNGNYTCEICPVVTGWYEVHILLNGYGVSNLPFQVHSRQESQGLPSGSSSGSSHRGQYVHNSPYRVYVRNNVASGATSTVEVERDLRGCTVGVLASFMITLRDSYGNVVREPLTENNISFHVFQSPEVSARTVDLGNGSHTLSFTPTKTGLNFVQVSINGAPIVDSPFNVPVYDGNASSSHSLAVGGGLHSGRAGFVSFFQVLAFDLDGNRKSNSDDTFVFTTSKSEVINGTLLPCIGDENSLKYCGEYPHDGGLYYAVFVPTVSGFLNISVYLLDEDGRKSELKNTPVVARIYPGPPHAENTIVSGTLNNATVGVQYFVTIVLRDQFGNRLESGGEDVELVLNGVSGDWGTIQPFGTLPGLKDTYNYAGHHGPYSDLYGIWVDHSDGSYTGTFTITTTGVYVMRLSIAEPGLNVTFFNDTTFGYLVTFDDNIRDFVANTNGRAVNLGNTISWTGDIGGRPGRGGDLGEGSYIHFFKTRVESMVYLDNREGSSDNGNLSNTVFSVDEKYREDYWSVRYVGLINADYSEIYNFTAVADLNSEVTLWIGGLGMATNMSWRGDSVLHLNTSVNVSEGQYSFTDTKLREFVLEYRHFNGPEIYLQLLWESPSTPKSVVPAHAFRHWRNISHYNVTANPSALCSSCSTAFGSALNSAIVGKLHSFVVYARDIYSNLLQRGGDPLSVVAVGSDGVAFRGVVTDYGNSTYLVEYYPTKSGTYRLYIAIGCCTPHPNVGISREIGLMRPLLVEGSPFLLRISPSTVDPSRTVAVGSSLISGEAGTLKKFEILFRDIHNNPTSIEPLEGLPIDIYCTSTETGQRVFNYADTVVTLSNSSATAAYNITSAGSYLMHVQIMSRDIIGSPFPLFIHPTTPHAKSSVVRGVGKHSAHVNSSSHFEVTIKDKYNNTCVNGGHKLYLRLVGSNRRNDVEKVIVPLCKDMLNGLFKCSYITQVPGEYELRVMLVASSDIYPGGRGLNGLYFADSGGYRLTDNKRANQESIPFLTRIEREVFHSFTNGFAVDITSTDYSNLSTPLNSIGLSSVDFSSGVSILWDGYLLSPLSADFGIQAHARHFNVSVYIDNNLVYSSVDGTLTHTLPVKMWASSVYAIRVEASATSYHVQQKNSYIRLTWHTNSTRETRIPAFYLHDHAEAVAFSPFLVVVED